MFNPLVDAAHNCHCVITRDIAAQRRQSLKRCPFSLKQKVDHPTLRAASTKKGLHERMEREDSLLRFMAAAGAKPVPALPHHWQDSSTGWFYARAILFTRSPKVSRLVETCPDFGRNFPARAHLKCGHFSI